MKRCEWKFDFGENLELMLKEASITPAQLAYKTGLSRSTISNYILGKRMPTVEAVLAIAYVLDCSTDDLIDLSGPIDR